MIEMPPLDLEDGGAGGRGAALERRGAPRAVPDWPGLWDDAPEVDMRVRGIEGCLPEGLCGTLFRNGPGSRRFARYFFGGDGMMRALRFEADGVVRYQSRYVQTPKYLAERRGSRPRMRTAGRQLPGGFLGNFLRMPASEANTGAH